MTSQVATKPDRAQSLDQDISRLRQQLDGLKKSPHEGTLGGDVKRV